MFSWLIFLDGGFSFLIFFVFISSLFCFLERGSFIGTPAETKVDGLPTELSTFETVAILASIA